MSQMLIADLEFIEGNSVHVRGLGKPSKKYSASYATDYDTDYSVGVSSGYSVDKKKKTYTANVGWHTSSAVSSAIGAAIAVGGTTYTYANANARTR